MWVDMVLGGGSTNVCVGGCSTVGILDGQVLDVWMDGQVVDLLTTVLWFLCRRRRDRSDGQPDGGPAVRSRLPGPEKTNTAKR